MYIQWSSSQTDRLSHHNICLNAMQKKSREKPGQVALAVSSVLTRVNQTYTRCLLSVV